MSPAQVIDGSADLACWRARAERAEAAAARLRQENSELNARVAALSAEVGRLLEAVTTLSGLLFGTSSEKRAPAARGGGAGEDGAGGRSHSARRRGQRPGAPGHGRRSYAHLETEERVIDLEPQERRCARCGTGYELIGTEDSELIDWRVKLIRILLRRRRYRRRCACDGPKTACAPPAPKVVPKGLFTAGFLARLLHEKYVLGRPVHRIVAALAAEGLEIASGTLAGELRQVAPLLAPWAQAIAARGAARIQQAGLAGDGLLHPAAARVIATLNNEWDGLARHQDLPQLPLDNNTAERALRNSVIGRKNFYGSGARWAADLAADVWTITATAAQNGLEPLPPARGLPDRLRPGRRHRARRSGPGTLPALDTPRTRPPRRSRRYPARSRPVTSAAGPHPRLALFRALTQRRRGYCRHARDTQRGSPRVHRLLTIHVSGFPTPLTFRETVRASPGKLTEARAEFALERCVRQPA